MQDYLGNGLSVEYFKSTDKLEIKSPHGGVEDMDQFYIYLGKLQYEALKSFAQCIGWEEQKNG